MKTCFVVVGDISTGGHVTLLLVVVLIQHCKTHSDYIFLKRLMCMFTQSDIGVIWSVLGSLQPLPEVERLEGSFGWGGVSPWCLSS